MWQKVHGHGFHAVLCQKYAKKGGIGKQRSTGNDSSVRSFILETPYLYSCSNFTSLQLPLNSNVKHLSAVLFSAQVS